MAVVVEIRYVYLRLRTSDRGAASTRPGLPGRLAVAITRGARTCPPKIVSPGESTWLKAPSSGSTPTRATASLPLTTEPPTCSSITPPSRLTASAVCRTTSGSPTPPVAGPRARRPRKFARSNRPRAGIRHRLARPACCPPAPADGTTVCRVAGDQAARVDSWIWSVRLTRTRSAASAVCRAGHVKVNGVRVKPAHPVRAGDEVRLRYEGRERVVIVQRIIAKRVGALVAA